MEFLAGIYTDRSQYAEAEALLKKVYDCLVAQKRDQEPFAAAIMSDLAFRQFGQRSSCRGHRVAAQGYPTADRAQRR